MTGNKVISLGVEQICYLKLNQKSRDTKLEHLVCL